MVERNANARTDETLSPIAETLADDVGLMNDVRGLIAGDVKWDEIEDTPGEDPAIVWAETLGGSVDEWREIFA